MHVPDYEVCATTPSVDLTPYQSEYEGYMGNYGNTLDRWYRRAAVVVWPRDRAFAARAEAGSQWALHQLRDRIEAGDLDGARAAAESLAPFWKRVGAQPGLLGAALDVAAGLDAAGTAAMLLEPFRIETVAQEHAGGLAAAAGRYGDEWTRSVVDGWFGPGHPYGTDLYEWVDNRLSGLCGALRAAGEPDGGAAAGRRSLAPDGHPAPTLDQLRTSRAPPATAGDAELAAGATAGGGRRRTPRRGHCGAAHVRGQRSRVPDAGAAPGGRAAGGGTRRGRPGLRGAARRDHRAAAARRGRLVDRMDRVWVRPV